MLYFLQKGYLAGLNLFTEYLHCALKDGIVLIKALQDIAEYKIPHYEQESSHTDQHYALPLSVFLLHKEMYDHFTGKQESKDQENPMQLPFHTLLIRYIRTLYSADSMLPIGQQYDEIPFLVSRSLNVSETRSKMFYRKILIYVARTKYYQYVFIQYTRVVENISLLYHPSVL